MFEDKRDVPCSAQQLRERLMTSKARIERTRESIAVKESLNKEFSDLQRAIEIYNHCRFWLMDRINDVKEYNADKAKNATLALYSAFSNATSIVPDINSPIKLDVKRETAGIYNNDGYPIEDVEGSAFRASLALFIRYTLLKNSEYEPFVILDECLNTLSPAKAQAVSQFLPLIATGTASIFIEHKEEVFTHFKGITYLFECENDVTTVRRLSSSEEEMYAETSGSNGDSISS